MLGTCRFECDCCAVHALWITYCCPRWHHSKKQEAVPLLICMSCAMPDYNRSQCCCKSHVMALPWLCCLLAAGFCGETEDEHLATVDLLRNTCYDNAFLFSYSEREKTYASRHYSGEHYCQVQAYSWRFHSTVS